MSLYTELKRRNVFRVAAAYIVVGWLLLQVADIIFGFIHAPDWAGKAVVAMLVLGFVPALAIAWVFEVTPEGVRRDSGAVGEDGHHRARRLDIITIVAVLIVAGITFWEQMQPAQEAQTAAPEPAPRVPDEPSAVTEDAEPSRPAQPIADNSIAVLPFANRSDAPESAFFVDGVHDDLLTQLARIGSLKVISRTSVLEYRDTTKNMREIGQELGVATVLEGAVQRAGNRVRITAQLIDTQTDEHLWADSFDRQLSAENVFDIQTDIARAIAGALVTTLSPEQIASIGEAQPTDVQEAYDLYLQARATGSVATGEEIRETIRLYEQALSLDTEFALAMGEIGHQYTNLYWYVTQDPAHRAKGGEYIARSLALAPEEPRLHWIRADHLYHGYLDYDGALAELAIAEQGMPNGADIYELKGYILRRRGDFAGAEAALEQAIRLDPRNSDTIADHAFTFGFQGDIDTARIWSSRLQTIPNVDLIQQAYQPELELVVAGNTRPAREFVESLPDGLPSEIAWLKIDVPFLERRFDDALVVVEQLPDDPVTGQWLLWPKSLVRARIALARGDVELARAQALQALEDLGSELDRLPDNPRPVAARALALAILGREGDARAEALRATELYPVTQDVPMGPAYLADRLKVLAIVADTEELAREMTEYLALPAKIHHIDYLLLDPVFDRHRDHPGIQALEKQYSLKGGGA